MLKHLWWPLILTSCLHPAAPPKTQVNEAAKALAPNIVLDADDPSTCAACHQAVVTEWNQSLHRHAHHSNDPLYASMRSLRAAKQGPAVLAGCANCHSPRDVSEPESRAAQTGVSCATCHQLDGVHPGDAKGANALAVAADKHFRGPHDIADGTSPLHANGPALPALTDGTSVCLACHREERNAAGLPTCSTGIEHASLDAKPAPSCTGCHMKEVEGPSGVVSARPRHRSHDFRGPHQVPTMLDEAVRITGRFDKDTLVLRLENLTGHAFPTGFPGRLALLEVRGLDEHDSEVFSTVSPEPVKDHPELVFNVGYADAAGTPTLAPFATTLVRDNRLKAGEVREIPIVFPKGASQAAVHLRFFVLAPNAAKALAFSGAEAKPFAGQRVVLRR